MSLLPTDRATITADEAAAILGVGRNSVYEAVQRGELPSLRVGRRLLLPVAKLRALLEPELNEAGPR